MAMLINIPIVLKSLIFKEDDFNLLVIGQNTSITETFKHLWDQKGSHLDFPVVFEPANFALLTLFKKK
ncbi:hypothetical protein [Bartonella tamiae]|uniref:Uncharacterized protein n=1 Tax=Bartonella tamiae Th239 TaxID=1094558 RepID=J0QSF0_9HYPH|nr:hypothetical protein [Bartonella tamiae]EJF88791.1 hypothetical protein ME5_01342 [Bartonella tamiae Th239]EJF94959.1 hypothetical protein MEG_00540 [Bartonella tamiae Th307]